MKLNYKEVRFVAWFPTPEQIAKVKPGSPQLVVYECDDTGKPVWALDTHGNLWRRGMHFWYPEKEVWS